MPAIRTRISGPPGTGKTTYEIELVAKLIERGFDPENIVYTTFTKAAATEARDRTCARFDLPKDKFPYFRTLHSLCHELTGSLPVLQGRDYCQIGKDLGLFFTIKTQEADGMGGTRGDAILKIVNLASANMVSIEEQFNARAAHESFQDISLEEVTAFNEHLEAYKAARGLRDFTDMLTQTLAGEPPHFDVVIGDEAQDFSKLQWAVFDHLCVNAKEVFYAGDDDQCIHSWAGADVHSFVQRGTASSIVLSQSYRVPQKVHTLAQGIIQQIPPTLRVEKSYKPRAYPGDVRIGVSVDDLQPVGQWLLLARNRVHLEVLAESCTRQGILFSGPVSVPGLAEYLRARESWAKLLKGQSVTKQEALDLYAHLSIRDRVERGSKTLLADADHSWLFSWDLLHSEFGLRTNAETDIALDKVEPSLKAYVKEILARDGEIKPPTVEINTIHAVKGREAENVAICLDMTEKTWRSYQENPDSEHRVFYVGVTRAKKTLTILQPWTQKYYSLPTT